LDELLEFLISIPKAAGLNPDVDTDATKRGFSREKCGDVRAYMIFSYGSFLPHFYN
jgi:hypothetical protein